MNSKQFYKNLEKETVNEINQMAENNPEKLKQILSDFQVELSKPWKPIYDFIEAKLKAKGVKVTEE